MWALGKSNDKKILYMYDWHWWLWFAIALWWLWIVAEPKEKSFQRMEYAIRDTRFNFFLFSVVFGFGFGFGFLLLFMHSVCMLLLLLSPLSFTCVCVLFFVLLLLLFLSYRWSTIWVVRVHDFSDQTMKRGKTTGVSGIITASVYRWNYALAPKVEKPTAPFRVSILACSKRIHWNIILFVKCFT